MKALERPSSYWMDCGDGSDGEWHEVMFDGHKGTKREIPQRK